MIQVLPSLFLSYESSWRYDLVVSTDDILILSLLSRYNALTNVGDFYLIHLCDSCSFNKKLKCNISRSPFIKHIIYSMRFVIIKTFIKKIFASTSYSWQTKPFESWQYYLKLSCSHQRLIQNRNVWKRRKNMKGYTATM